MTDDQLRGWKEIATFLGTSARTAQRWEAELGLPIHRLSARPGATVFALPAELIAWRQSTGERKAGETAVETVPAVTGLAGESPRLARLLAVAPDLSAAPPSAVLDATPRPTLRRRRRVLISAVLGVLAVTAMVVAGTAVRRQGRALPSASTQSVGAGPSSMIIFRLTWQNGFSSTMGIPNGGIGTVTFGGKRLQFSPRLADGTVRLEVGELREAVPPGTAPVVPVAVFQLRAGARASIGEPSPFTIEWVSPPSAPSQARTGTR